MKHSNKKNQLIIALLLKRLRCCGHRLNRIKGSGLLYTYSRGTTITSHKFYRSIRSGRYWNWIFPFSNELKSVSTSIANIAFCWFETRTILSAFWEVFETFVNNCRISFNIKSLYNPGWNVRKIFHSHGPFCVYVLSKPRKYGIKMYTLWDAVSYYI